MKNLYIKEWLIDKIQAEAGRYDVYIDHPERSEIGTPVVRDGFVMVVIQEMIKETEKAIYVRLSSGSVVGSYKGWRCWLPKSQIKEVA